jgi:hypothetical protein
MCNRVEINVRSLAPKTRRFKRDHPAASEAIEDSWRLGWKGLIDQTLERVDSTRSSHILE